MTNGTWFVNGGTRSATCSMVVKLKINGQTASGRTRKKIKQFGPDFEIVEVNIRNPRLSNQTLFRSVKSGWFGWLPNNEILIERFSNYE
jgi:hypothetical protein